MQSLLTWWQNMLTEKTNFLRQSMLKASLLWYCTIESGLLLTFWILFVILLFHWSRALVKLMVAKFHQFKPSLFKNLVFSAESSKIYYAVITWAIKELHFEFFSSIWNLYIKIGHLPVTVFVHVLNMFF